MSQLPFFLAAAAAALVQARLLRRAALRPLQERSCPPTPWQRAAQACELPLRLFLVVGVLVAAARAGCLGAAVAGWACGFALSATVLAWRWS
jgi:hypothetical protein